MQLANAADSLQVAPAQKTDRVTTISPPQQELIEKQQRLLAIMADQGDSSDAAGGGTTTNQDPSEPSRPRDPETSDRQNPNLLYNALKRQAAASESSSQDGKIKKARTNEEGKEPSPASPGLTLQAAGSQAHAMLRQGPTLGDSQLPLSSNVLTNEQYMAAEMHARRLQQEAAINRNAVLMASLLGQPQGHAMAYPSLQQQLALQGQAMGNFGGPTIDSFLAGLINRNQSTQGLLSNSLSQQLQPHAQMLTPNSVDVNTMLRHLTWPATGLQAARALDSANRAVAARAGAPGAPVGTSLRLPPCDEGLVPPFIDREKFPLGVDEDPNWLSEFHCFVRSELIEVCRASHDDCKSRNNATSYQQVGIRCRFCAHRPPTARGCRSSAYPSSIRQIYQSFTMMLRDHFGLCEAMPDDMKQRFLTLKDKPSQGATDSKRYWMYSAMKAGLADSPDGIIINQTTVLAGMNAPPFGSEDTISWQREGAIARPLVTSGDASLGNSFIHSLLTQLQIIQLRESERIGNRRSLEHGLPGFSCRCCWEKRRLGLCRMFPARRRTLLQKLMDLYDHLRRCQATPDAVKKELERLRSEVGEEAISDSGEMKALLDRVWIRLGHGV